MTFQEIEVGVVYEITHDGGQHYEMGDHVYVIAKEPGRPFHCRNMRTGGYFFVPGASSFKQVQA